MPSQQILMEIFATLQKYFAFKDTGETAAAALAKQKSAQSNHNATFCQFSVWFGDLYLAWTLSQDVSTIYAKMSASCVRTIKRGFVT